MKDWGLEVKSNAMVEKLPMSASPEFLAISDAGLLHRFEEKDANLNVLATPESWERYRDVESINSNAFEKKIEFMGFMTNAIRDARKQAGEDVSAIIGERGRQLSVTYENWIMASEYAGHPEAGILICTLEQREEFEKMLQRSLRECWYMSVLAMIDNKGRLVTGNEAPFLEHGKLS